MQNELLKSVNLAEQVGTPDYVALRPDPEHLELFLTNARPFTSAELNAIPAKLAAEGRLADIEQVGAANRQLWQKSQKIGIFLDGRSDKSDQGWLGDMVEASRLIRTIQAAGKEIVIVTTNPDLFSESNGIDTVAMPREISSKGLNPYNPEVLSFCQGKVDAMLFPINAYLPVLIEPGTDGQPANQAVVDQFRQAVDPSGWAKGVNADVWSKQKVHQLQTLQFLSWFVGIEQAAQWTEFPEAYIQPDADAQRIAEQVMAEYGQLPETHGVPLFIHLGVATESNKVAKKYYTQQKWGTVLELLAEQHLDSPLTFFCPPDPEQTAATLQLAESARKLGFSVSVLNMAEIRQRFGWNLGAFAHYLRLFQQQGGIMLGVDSMPAAHMAPAVHLPSVVLGNGHYPQTFFCPPKDSIVVMSTESADADQTKPENVALATSLLIQKQIPADLTS